MDSDTHSLAFGQIVYFIHATESVAVFKRFSIVNAKHHFQLTFDLLNSRLFPVAATDSVTTIPVNNILENAFL